MNIQVRIEGRRGILTLTGPLTRDTEGTLQQRLDDLLRQGIRDFVLEIAGVPFMDSNGLGQLVQAYKAIKSNGAHLQIVGVTGRMAELVSLVKPGEPKEASPPAPPPSTSAPREEGRPRPIAFWLALAVTLVILLFLILRLAGARL